MFVKVMLWVRSDSIRNVRWPYESSCFSMMQGGGPEDGICAVEDHCRRLRRCRMAKMKKMQRKLADLKQRVLEAASLKPWTGPSSITSPVCLHFELWGGKKLCLVVWIPIGAVACGYQYARV